MKIRVLIVEDEKALVELLEYNFKQEGYIVETAMDGEIALDKITFKPPDLIILDWMLPKSVSYTHLTLPTTPYV